MHSENISWDEYFMGLALLSSFRSKDNHTKVGACIVNSKKRIVGLGYNGMPDGCLDSEMPWGHGDTNLNTKYYYVVHAELNAILNALTQNLENCIIYTTLFPCCECAKAIIQSGIKEVIYFSDKYHDNETTIASRIMLEKANIRLTPYSSKGRTVNITV